MAKKSYYEKLKDPRWQKKRLEVLEANEFKCEVCFDGTSTLHVHHKEYFKDLEPWEYANEQLAVLCESCHEITHDGFDLLKWVCSYARLDGPSNREELAILLAGYMGIPYEDLMRVSGIGDFTRHRITHSIGEFALQSLHERIHEIANRNSANIQSE